jgi:GMP synthase-like glutamine amidotransferase
VTLAAGGHYSAYEDREWIRELAEWLAAAVQAHPEVKFLGICFGCQILARGEWPRS